MSRNINKKIYSKIKKYKNIVIARHIGPDPDAIASQIALRDAIRLTFPNKNVYAIGASVNRFKKFGNLDKIDFDKVKDCLLIITDVPTLNRVDDIIGLDYKEIVKIDHHPCNEVIGSLEIVDETSSSACQLVAELIINTPLKMNQNIAGNLFLGIVSDSDRFLLSYTSSKTFNIISYLVEKENLDISSLYNSLYERPINEIKFHGFIANNLTLTDNGLAYIKVTPEIIKEYNVDLATPSNMINDFNFIKEVLVWTFITFDEKNDIYKINIRSKGPIINEIAENYHGGGHKFASGARITNIEEVDKLINDLDKICEKFKSEALSEK